MTNNEQSTTDLSAPPMHSRQWTRRELLARAGAGAGLLGLATMLSDESANTALAGDSTPSLLARKPHFPGKAKSVIWLFMNGGPSQVDTWDHKPELAKRDGKALEGFDPNTGFFNGAVGPIMKSPFKFQQHGECGAWASDLFPRMARHVDKMGFIHSCYTDSNNHSPALFMINTGMTRMGFPCVGSWVTYGLGTESRNLPAFIAMSDPLGRGLPKGHALNWGAGFLPSIYQGTWLRPSGQPIPNLDRPAEMTDAQQKEQLRLLKTLNNLHLQSSRQEKELAARIDSFELAYRMQISAPEALDIQQETKSIHELYGVDHKPCRHFATQCLMARRLVERGVRFIQIYSGGMENARSWDGHSNIVKNHRGFAAETDQPIAALLTDLKQRGLLDSTLVVWGGEFGATAARSKRRYGTRPQSPRVYLLDGGRRSQRGRPSRRHGRNRQPLG